MDSFINSFIDSGVSIPMFSAKGLLLEKKNGELITPFYFAYEDLLDDWSRITSASSESKPSNPDVKVTDFTDVMCLSQGISSESITTSVKTPKGGKEDGKIQKMKLIQTNPAIIPPKVPTHSFACSIIPSQQQHTHTYFFY